MMSFRKIAVLLIVTISSSIFADEPMFEPNAYTSPNGEFCVLDNSGGLVPVDFDKDFVLFTVLKNGEAFAKITVGDVFSDTKQVVLRQRTASHYRWGRLESLENDGIRLLTTVGEKWYDFKTKSVPETALKPKSPILEHDDFMELDFYTSDNRDFVRDSETAVQIAVAIWAAAYGKDEIEKEKPYIATEHEGFWYVHGSLPKDWLGGVAYIKIRKKDGAVMGYIHTK